MKIRKPHKLSPSESMILIALKAKHQKVVQAHHRMLAISASKARVLAIKIEALEKQMIFFEKSHQDLLEKQLSAKKKPY